MNNTIERALEKQRQLLEAAEETSELNDQQAAVINPPLTAKTQVADPSLFVNQPAVTGAEADEPHADALDPRAPIGSASARNSQAPSAPAPEAREDVYIDIDFLERTGMMTPTENFSKIKEEYRYIKRPLLNNAFGSEDASIPNANLIMVSSTHSGEGKTFTAINLAISMVLEQDRTVLLVDADVINPHVCKRLNIEEDGPGLMDYLRGEATVSDIILSTNIPKLKIITAGSRYHHSNEMFASEKMRQFTQELSTRYSDRIVVFDTAPLLGASETKVLSQLTGQAVIVVEQERTKQGNLERALGELSPNQAVGLVLNKSRSSRREYYGYYYAGKD